MVVSIVCGHRADRTSSESMCTAALAGYAIPANGQKVSSRKVRRPGISLRAASATNSLRADLVSRPNVLALIRVDSILGGPLRVRIGLFRSCDPAIACCGSEDGFQTDLLPAAHPFRPAPRIW